MKAELSQAKAYKIQGISEWERSLGMFLLLLSFTDKKNFKKGFGQKMKGGVKTQTQVFHNHYISTKPRVVTSPKSG